MNNVIDYNNWKLISIMLLNGVKTNKFQIVCCLVKSKRKLKDSKLQRKSFKNQNQN